jgi:hypothetical protein
MISNPAHTGSGFTGITPRSSGDQPEIQGRSGWDQTGISWGSAGIKLLRINYVIERAELDLLE